MQSKTELIRATLARGDWLVDPGRDGMSVGPIPPINQVQAFLESYMCRKQVSRHKGAIVPSPKSAVANNRLLFDHLVGAGKQSWGHDETDGVRRLEVDN